MQAVQPAPRKDGSILTFPRLAMLSNERALIGAHIGVALLALAIGLLLGPLQAYHRAPALKWDIPVFSYYYQALTLHGVLNALVFTTFFIVGFSYFVVQRSLQRPLASIMVGWVAWVLMFVGVVLAGYAMLTGQANVLYTFYAPMLAHWTFYLGLALVIVGSWVAGGNIFVTYIMWRREHKGQAVPLAVFGTVANFIMWITASLGVAIEVLTMLLPLSLGIVQTTDPQVSRILFWFFGHPLVYFWLLPAYISWYTMMPIQFKVPVFSDALARVAFIVIMIVSIPIGVHHLFSDPGVSEVAKVMHSFLTFVVAVPSFLTAFNIAATLERAGRTRGGTGLLGWIWKLDWGNPVIATQILGMLMFVIGGVTGLMNASFALNVALHNTTWVPGHFHTTLAGGVFMTYMAVLYWMLPIMRGRKLFSRPLATAQAYTWFVGMLMFGISMGRAGVEGASRRTDVATMQYISPAWEPWLNITAIAGTILLISIVLLFIVIIGTWFFSKGEPEDPAPITTIAPKSAPLWAERWNLWIAIIVISNVIMWGPVLLEGLNFVNGFWAVGYRMN
ncbi:MAG: cbb3-type cytochrome c oxidase subunit I [Chloroflexi bacterium]|nr:cbb3-type cytochrome c oxidase subunit I [Chloroflexota bacterium]